MRIWDVDPGYLDRQRLLGEHRELHGLWNVWTLGKKGYSRHPETLRWEGCLQALALRHELLVQEMALRGYNHQSPLEGNEQGGAAGWPGEFIDPPAVQFDLLREKYGTQGGGRISLPVNTPQLWAQHKYSVMARDPELYKTIGADVAGGAVDYAELALLLIRTLRRPPAEGRLGNGLLHMWGYVRDRSAPEQPPEDSRALLSVIRVRAAEQDVRYLLDSTALGELGAWTG